MAARNVRIMRCTPDDVFAALADGWLYPVWVVGASRMRAVDPEWPAPGSRIHHSLGVWPILVDDTTEIVEWSPPDQVRLRARAGLLGRGVIVLEVREGATDASGAPTTRVRMGEEPVSGPTLPLPRVFWAPLLTLRNHEALNRLAYIAEGRARARATGLDTRPDAPGPIEGDPTDQAERDVREADEAGTDAADARSDVAAEPEASTAPSDDAGPSDEPAPSHESSTS